MLNSSAIGGPQASRTSAHGLVRYLAFVFPLLGATGLAQSQPLFRSDTAVIGALTQSQNLSHGVSTLIGRLALSLPFGDLHYRLALPSLLGCGLLGLACFELAYALFRAQGGLCRLDPWLAWGASMIGSLSLPAAAEGTVAGGATLAPALSIYLCARLVARRLPRGLSETAVFGVLSGALLGESVHCTVLLALAALLLWPESRSMRGGALQSPRLIKALVFSSAAALTLSLIAFENGWFSHAWSFTDQTSTSFSAARPLTWLRAIGILWSLGAAFSCFFSLSDRRPLYVMCLLAAADWLLPAGPESSWEGALDFDASRTSLHLFVLGYLSAAGALGMRTFGETAQAVGLLGARQLSTLISVVAVAGSLAASEDALLTLSQSDAEGAEAWSEEALQSLPPRALLITESAARGQRLVAAQLMGSRPDVLVVPLSELSQARNVRDWLEKEPELHLLLVDLSLGNLPSERAIGRLVDRRPVFVEPNETWDRRLLEHLEPRIPLSRLSPHALARSDRLAALEDAPIQIDHILDRATEGLHRDDATLEVLRGDLLKLEDAMAHIDHVAAERVAGLGDFGPEVSDAVRIEPTQLEPLASRR